MWRLEGPAARCSSFLVPTLPRGDTVGATLRPVSDPTTPGAEEATPTGGRGNEEGRASPRFDARLAPKSVGMGEKSPDFASDPGAGRGSTPRRGRSRGASPGGGDRPG